MTEPVTTPLLTAEAAHCKQHNLPMPAMPYLSDAELHAEIAKMQAAAANRNVAR